jgi:hypothetical protein
MRDLMMGTVASEQDDSMSNAIVASKEQLQFQGADGDSGMNFCALAADIILVE